MPTKPPDLNLLPIAFDLYDELSVIRRARVARLQEDLLKKQPFDPGTSTRAFTLALSDVGEMAFLPLVIGPLRSQAPNCALHSVSVAPGQLAHELEKGDVDVA